MLFDEYGNELSTQSEEARDFYNIAVNRFLGAEPCVKEAFEAAVVADPNFALAHVGYAREMHLRGFSDDLKKSLNRASELAGNLTEREISHLNVSTLLLKGKS